MRPTSPTTPLALAEFVPMMALMISIVALAIDAMLPALGLIGRDLAVADPNDPQLVVSSLLFGLAVAQLLFGPLSDTIGRRPAILAGYGLFIVGCVLSMAATSFEVMLAGRVLQGAGAAGPRVVSMALVRDQYAGRPMARIMSIIMAVFIIVPAVAPALGEAVLAVTTWRAIFTLLLALAVVSGLWFAIRQPETLAEADRKPFSLTSIARGVGEVYRAPGALAYTTAAGLVFGAFVGYLNASQQIFHDTYGQGSLFAFYFAVGAVAIGAASVVNARLVIRLGMRHLCRQALWALSGLSAVFAAVALAAHGVPPLWLFVAWMVPAFFCMGILFGNFNALAMEPLGHIAGLGAAVVGGITTFVSLVLGTLIGRAYDGTVLPLVAGFAGLSVAALLVMAWAERQRGTR